MTQRTLSKFALPPFLTFWGFGAPVFALLALVALLQPTLLGTVDANLAGWSPEHGHIYAGGVAIPHTHPWDVSAGSGSRRTSVSPTRGDAVVFTWGQDGSVRGAGSLLLIPSALRLGSSPSVYIPPIPLRSAVVASDPLVSVPTPPPQF